MLLDDRRSPCPISNKTASSLPRSYGKLGTSRLSPVYSRFIPFGNIAKSGRSTFAATYSSATNHYTLSGVNVQYDNDGNLLTDNLNTYTWNVYGSAATINSTTLVYDAFGRMVEQQNGSVYSQRLYSPMGKTAIMNGQTLTKAFVALPGGETAIYNTSGLAYYRHADWLGSSRMTSTASRTVYSDSAYAPFGEQYAVTGTVDASFTGQNSDTVTSLYDFTFREHSPSQGRWISPDPAGLAAVNPMNPQSWNRYAYVLNNPMSLIDPFGDDCYDSNGNATSAGSEAECFGGGGGASWWDPTTGTWWVPTTSTVSSVQGNNIETTSLQAQETLTAANNGPQQPQQPQKPQQPTKPTLKQNFCFYTSPAGLGGILSGVGLGMGSISWGGTLTTLGLSGAEVGSFAVGAATVGPYLAVGGAVLLVTRGAIC